MPDSPVVTRARRAAAHHRQSALSGFVGRADGRERTWLTYNEADAILYLLVDERYSVAEAAEEGGYDPAFVSKIWERVKANHFKRTMPNIAKVSRRTIGHDFLYLRDYTGRHGKLADQN